jgi:hypothetical protein
MYIILKQSRCISILTAVAPFPVSIFSYFLEILVLLFSQALVRLFYPSTLIVAHVTMSLIDWMDLAMHHAAAQQMATWALRTG